MNIRNYYPDKKSEAATEFSMLDAMAILAKNNDLACEIHIAGVKIGLCDNSWILPVLDQQRAEVQKFLDGKPNLFE